MALLVASGANLLVLDEPTNHLDVESREALEAALEAFPGTILLVSHDRALLDAVPGSHRRHRGPCAALLRRRLGGHGARARGGECARADRRAAHAGRPRAGREAATREAERRPSSSSWRTQIAGVEASIAELERKLADDWSDMDVLGAHSAARDELVALLERWEVVFGEAQTT